MEFYARKPDNVDVFLHNGCTDIILRKNIVPVVSDNGDSWQCEERQMRVAGIHERDSIQLDFEKWWNLAETGGRSLDARVETLELDSSEIREALNMILERTVV